MNNETIYETNSSYINFSSVLNFFRDYPEHNLKFAREGWNGKCMYISLQIPDENSKMTRPYLYLKTAQGTIVPWCPSQTDLLMDDWIQLPQDL